MHLYPIHRPIPDFLNPLISLWDGSGTQSSFFLLVPAATPSVFDACVATPKPLQAL